MLICLNSKHSETRNTEEGDEAQKEQTSETNISGELTSSEENSEIIELVESACIILASIVHPREILWTWCWYKDKGKAN